MGYEGIDCVSEQTAVSSVRRLLRQVWGMYRMGRQLSLKSQDLDLRFRSATGRPPVDFQGLRVGSPT